MTVGERLKKARKAAKITGEALGNLIGVSKAQISNIEKGTSQLTKSNAIVLAAHLGVDPDWLLGGGSDEIFTNSPSSSASISGNKFKQEGNTVTIGQQPGTESGAPDLRTEIEKLRMENEHLKQRLKDKEEMIELLKKK